MPPELVKQMAMSVLRKGLVALGVYLGATEIDASAWNELVSAALVIAGTGWSLYVKYRESKAAQS